VIRQTFPAAIQIADTVASDLWPLKANPTQLHQVLLNLCVNARDAMPQGGTLQLRAVNRSVDDAGAAALPGMRPGAYLLFEVTDTGTGIPPEILPRIWEPFFTTKDAGSGTGLGLSTVRAIVENHHGVVAVHSRAGRGTTFQVYFPAAPGVELPPGLPAGSPTRRGHGELILVVDDDANIREVTCAVLVRHGFRALAAADGAEAVALFAPRTLEIRAVVTDLSMPVLDGVTLTKVIRNLNPSIRVLAITGQPDHQDRFQRQQPSSPFLLKPFSGEALLEAIHALLESSDSLIEERVINNPA
jgi:CheY-like chemotaxis protein